ncbi:MAG: carboxypeptidase regulatory-like domain-containing protein [Aeromicrobium sp.]
MGRSTSSWLTRFTIAFAMAGAATLQSAPAMAAIPTAIAGKVTNNAGGAAVAGVQVTAYRLSGGSWNQQGFDFTDAGGNYVIDELSAGTYRIGFDGAITSEYWNDKATLDTATDIPVVQNQTASGKNASVTLGGHVTGTVSDASGPIKDAQVSAVDAGGNFVAYGYTNASGAYDLGVPSGNWRLRFGAYDHIEEYYNDKATLGAADSFTVGSGSTVSGKNAVLANQSRISGTVTKLGGGGLVGIDVNLSRPDGLGGWDSSSWVSTNASGAYTLTGLDAGTYRICFSDENDNYISECYDNKATVSAATDVVVGTSASVSGKNAELAPGGHITGTITKSAGGPSDACVDAYDGTGAQVGSACTDSSGNYDVGGLPSGSFRLYFEPFDDDAPEYYNDKATLAAADPIAVTAGSTTSGKNATLGASARIEGTVSRDGGGGPIPGVEVSLLDSAGNPAPGISNTYYTSNSGTYQFTGLAAGTYRLKYDDNEEGVTEYFDNSPTLAGSTGVVVTAGQTAIKNASLAGNGHITGTATRTGGFPLENADVALYAFDGVAFNEVLHTNTRSDGTYDLTPVSAGNYRLGFSESGYLGEYYDNKPDLASATSVTVSANGTVSGKNAELAVDSANPSGGFIGGVVTKAGGTPLAGVDVCLLRSSDSFSEFSCQNHQTGADGKYGFGDLAAGQYKVRFAKNDFGYSGHGQFVTEYYNNKATASAADILTITAAGEALTTVNAELAELSHVTGKVTKEDGVTPIADIGVSLSGDGPNYNSYYANTAADGTYDLNGVEAGSYTLEFNDYSNQTYVSEFYDDAATSSGATPVVVPADTVVSGKNARLAVGGHITGTVTAGGSPADPDCIDNIEALDAQDNLAWEADDSDGDVVDSTGKYDASPLRSGSYTVHVNDACGDYVGEWWDNAPTQSGASPISVTAPNTTSGKNFVLEAAGSISGTVTKTAGGAPLPGIVVEAYTAAGELAAGELENSELTGPDGTYVIDSLAAGSYRLRFRDPDGTYATEFFTNKASLATADPIAVGVGAKLTGKNADLGPSTPGHITGRVTKQDGTTALPNVRVSAYGSDWNVDATAVTDGSGNYNLSGLNGDDYLVKFLDLNGAYNTEWFDDAGNEDDATPVSLANGATVSGTNAKLASATEIQNDVAPSISGVARVGSTLTADDGEWTPATGLTLTRQWLADGNVISGATGTTYVPVAGDVGKKITVRVTAAKSGYTSAIKTSAPTDPVAGTTASALSNTVAPTITGTAKVGQTLTASNGTWSATPDSYVFAWKAGGSAVGTNANTYVPVAGDVGKTITVTVTAKKAGFTDGTATSAPTSAVQGSDFTTAPTPTISGTAKVGQTLTANEGTWVPTQDSFSYVWKAGGTTISGATNKTYVPVAGDVGKTITVTVTAKKAGYSDTTKTSAPTAAVVAADPTALTNTSAPTISGTPKVGQTLTANEGTWSATPDSYTYVWKAGGTAISGATSKTYVPVAGDVGKTITVTVTAKKSGLTNGTATSSPTPAVAAADASVLSNTSAPTISGTPKVGQTLTANDGTWSSTPDSYTYVWRAGGTVVSGATSKTYSPVAGDVGKTITVEVTAKKSGFTDGTAASSPTAAVQAADGSVLSNTAAPTISGTAKVGQTLTANEGAWSATPDSFTYVWKAGGTTISGATSKTYVPVAGDVGKTITVTVTAKKTGFNDGTATSAPTAAVTAADAGPAGGAFTPVTPYRVADTRFGTGVPQAKVAPNADLPVQVTGTGGSGGVPASGAGAVVVNVTAVAPSAAGCITAYPADAPQAPVVANLCFPPGATIPNHVTVKLGGDGRINLKNLSGGTVDLVADVAGWYADGDANQPGTFTPVTPFRMFDTRQSNPATCAPSSTKVAGDATLQSLLSACPGNIPGSGVGAAVVNVTVAGPSAAGFITAYATDENKPLAANVVFAAGQTIANAATVKVGSIGAGAGKTSFFNGSAGATDLISDFAGYFRSGAGVLTGAYNPVTPARLLDTRTGTGAQKVRVPAQGKLTFQVSGLGGVDESAGAAVLNVFAIGSGAPGYITAYPTPANLQDPAPTAANLVFASGQSVGNLVTVKLSTDGKVTLFNGSGASIDLAADIAGWYKK